MNTALPMPTDRSPSLRLRGRQARAHGPRASTPGVRLAAALALALPALGAAAAGSGLEVYGLAGLPGPGLGIGLPVAPGLSLRADIAGTDRISRTVTEDGITYEGTGKATRLGLFADWFPLAGRFRLTGGLTVNDMRLDLSASGAGRVLQIGGNAYTLGADDRYEVRGEFPSTTPYLGLGWGHHGSGGPGWGFIADVGVSLGKPKLTGQASGPWASQPGLQADIDRETQTLRDTVANIRVIPQISLGVNYRFR